MGVLRTGAELFDHQGIEVGVPVLSFVGVIGVVPGVLSWLLLRLLGVLRVAVRHESMRQERAEGLL